MTTAYALPGGVSRARSAARRRLRRDAMVRDAAVADVVNVVRVDGGGPGSLSLGVGAVSSRLARRATDASDAGGRPAPADATLRLYNYTNNSWRVASSASRSVNIAGAHENGAGRESSEMPPPARLATANATRARSTPNACAW